MGGRQRIGEGYGADQAKPGVVREGNKEGVGFGAGQREGGANCLVPRGWIPVWIPVYIGLICAIGRGGMKV